MRHAHVPPSGHSVGTSSRTPAHGRCSPGGYQRVSYSLPHQTAAGYPLSGALPCYRLPGAHLTARFTMLPSTRERATGMPERHAHSQRPARLVAARATARPGKTQDRWLRTLVNT